ncbi:MAG: FkbM family methyltransferase [Opitutales bacterium]
MGRTNNYFQGSWQTKQRDGHALSAFANLGRRLVLYDLGAAGGTPPPFCFIPKQLETISFEPDQRASTDKNGRRLSIAIGPKHLQTFYCNRRPTTSSLLPSNHAVTGRYEWSRLGEPQADIFETLNRESIEPLPLDSACAKYDLPDPDFMKVDLQGLTYELLEGGESTICRSVLGLKVEVEFIETYKGQKTFSAVHDWLSSRGFEIFNLSNLCSWHFKTQLQMPFKRGQHTFCDLTYFRSIDQIEAPEFGIQQRPSALLRLLLLHDFNDAAAAYLERFVAVGHLSQADAQGWAERIRTWPGAEAYFFRRRSAFQEVSARVRRRLGLEQRTEETAGAR